MMSFGASAPGLPILFQTGYGEEQVLGETENLKYFRVVTKPVAIPELNRMLRELLDDGSANLDSIPKDS